MYKLNFIKIKIFYSETDSVKRMKGQTTDWEKICLNHKIDGLVVSRIYKKV